jgi:Rrf2 family transcriptional regulator, cysteine metabolism repressor
MKLSRTVGYALQATLQLAQAEPGMPVPCSKLAAEGNMPERFLVQILRNLVNEGILHSTRGTDGGYSLERRADQISLLDLIEAVDGPVFTHAALGEDLSPELVDQLSDALKEVTASIRKELADIKLSSLVSHRRKTHREH